MKNRTQNPAHCTEHIPAGSHGSCCVHPHTPYISQRGKHIVSHIKNMQKTKQNPKQTTNKTRQQLMQNLTIQPKLQFCLFKQFPSVCFSLIQHLPRQLSSTSDAHYPTSTSIHHPSVVLMSGSLRVGSHHLSVCSSNIASIQDRSLGFHSQCSNPLSTPSFNSNGS